MTGGTYRFERQLHDRHVERIALDHASLGPAAGAKRGLHGVPALLLEIRDHLVDRSPDAARRDQRDFGGARVLCSPDGTSDGGCGKTLHVFPPCRPWIDASDTIHRNAPVNKAL